jgi:nucleotide-binding universal stress UspA family protein
MYQKMKSILVCTDFSDSAEHAANYACMFARQCHIPYITLFHAYQTYIATLSLPANLYDDDNIYQDSIKKLQDLQGRLSALAGPGVSINISAKDISLGESINRICQDENADLVVMGTKGKSNLEKAFMGTNTIEVAENSYFPVLVVPNEAKIESVQKILIACDLGKVTETIPVNLLNEVLNLFKAQLTVLNVDYKNKHFSPGTVDELYHIHHLFDAYNPEYAYTENKDVSSGILEYAEQHDISLIIVIPKNYNLFQGLFHRSTTESLIYRSRIPLLTLHAPQ